MTRPTQSLRCDEDVGTAHGCHEEGGQERDPIVFVCLCQIDGQCPQGEDGQCLVGPGKVSPNHVESGLVLLAVQQEGNGSDEEGQADHQAFGNASLFQVQEVCHNQTSRPESCIA